MKTLMIIVCMLSCMSCRQSGQDSGKNTKTFTGDFAGEPLDLTLTDLDDSLVKGMSSHKGEESEMSGKKVPSQKGFVYKMKELGTSRYRGVFDFELDTALNIVFGSWQKADTGDRTAILYTLRLKSGQ
jgi:uncharacterized lipoprotein YehR (DUF1307 family)